MNMQTGNVPMAIKKTYDLNGKKVIIYGIPCIPGIELFTECSSIVDAMRWEDINAKGLLRLAAYAAVEIGGVTTRLDNQNACLTYLTTEELWNILLEVYVENFGFFARGGTRSVMGPLIRMREEAAKEADKASEE